MTYTAHNLFNDLQDTSYSAVVQMPSHELQRIVRDLSQFHDTVNITCSKEGVQFSTTPDASTSQAKIILRPNSSSDTKESEQVRNTASSLGLVQMS